MKLSDISAIIVGMRGRMPESSRSHLAHKFVQLIGKNLTDPRDGAKLRVWEESGGVQKFFKNCELKSGLPWVNHELSAHDSGLATFINRWMNVESFKKPGETDFSPVTPEMNSIRCMMMEELKGIHEAQQRVTDHEQENRNGPHPSDLPGGE